jgi:pilus assembly protein CpaB
MAKRSGAGGVIVVALALGIGAAILIYQWAKDKEETAMRNRAQVVVAAKDILPNTKVSREMVMLIPIPRDLVADGAANRIEDVEGKFSLAQYRPKDQIRLKDVVTEDKVPTLEVKVPAGMRAVAIEANEVVAVGTGVKPGNRVDILATYHDPIKKQEFTKIILQNLEVLAVNKANTDASTKEGATTSMTLAVRPEQTELLAAASKVGAVRVALRSKDDGQIVETEGTTVVEIGGRLVLQEAQPVAPTNIPSTAATEAKPVSKPIIVLPARTRQEITVIRGIQEQVVTSQ